MEGEREGGMDMVWVQRGQTYYIIYNQDSKEPTLVYSRVVVHSNLFYMKIEKPKKRGAVWGRGEGV